MPGRIKILNVPHPAPGPRFVHVWSTLRSASVGSLSHHFFSWSHVESPAADVGHHTAPSGLTLLEHFMTTLGEEPRTTARSWVSNVSSLWQPEPSGAPISELLHAVTSSAALLPLSSASPPPLLPLPPPASPCLTESFIQHLRRCILHF